MSPQTKPGSAVSTLPDPSVALHEHVIAIQGLAKDFDLPTRVVADIYWPELARLRRGATVDRYLALLTARSVRDSLRRKPPADKRAERQGRDAFELLVD